MHVVDMANIHSTRTHMRIIQTMVTGLALGLFGLYDFYNKPTYNQKSAGYTSVKRNLNQAARCPPLGVMDDWTQG